MSKMPIKIKKAIRDAGKYYAKATVADKIFRDWLDSIGHGENYTILDQYIDGIELGNNASEDLIEFIEKEIG